MAWIAIGAWIAALVIAVVVLGFCGYEIAWKVRRLRGDVGGVQQLAAQLSRLHAELTGIRARLTATGAEVVR